MRGMQCRPDLSKMMLVSGEKEQCSHRCAAVQGNVVVSYFMQLWGEAWTRKYIREMVAVSGPWGGSVNTLKAAISGDNFKLYFPHNLLHDVQGTAPSAPWLFPSAHIWHADDVLVSTRNQSWSAGHLNDMLEVRLPCAAFATQ